MNMIKEPSMDSFLTTQEAADLLGVKDSRVRQLILDGTLTAVKKGRHLWLIKASDLKAAEKRKTKPGPAAKATTGRRAKNAPSGSRKKGARQR